MLVTRRVIVKLMRRRPDGTQLELSLVGTMGSNTAIDEAEFTQLMLDWEIAANTDGNLRFHLTQRDKVPA